MSKVLIVEDESHLANGLRFNLEAEGYQADVAESGEEALERLQSSAYECDLMLLDVMLPGKDGFEVVAEMRREGIFLPVMMLTARGQGEDVLQGLEAGADDYLPKPFDLDILVARIRGLLRRTDWDQRSEDSSNDEFDRYEFAGRTIDFERQEVTVRGEPRQLTLMESNLLRHLVQNEGKPVSRRALLEEVWGVREDTDTRAIDNFVVRLRRYIEDEPSKPRHLQTVRSVGYRFIRDPE